MNITKMVFLGAGSMSFGLSVFKDVFTSRELDGSVITLVDINQENLSRMTRLAELMNKQTGAGLKIESTTDRRSALDGAVFVINSTAIDRNRLWKLDFEIPKKYGIRHTLGENGGPGGLFFTLRTLPLIFDFARDIEEKCPEALFINFSNPESRIVLGLGKWSKVRAIGLCHGIFMGRNDVAKIMAIPEDQVDVWGAGLNHFQWLLQIRHRLTGEDLYPLLREKENLFPNDFMPLTRRMFHAFHYWVTCSDDHMGEYLPFGWEGGEEGYDFEEDQRSRDNLKVLLDDILERKRNIPSDWFKPSGERGIAVVSGILHNKKQLIESSVVYNQGAIPNLPDELAVEVPIMVDAAGVHPVSLGPLPNPIAKLLQAQANVQQLAVEAAVHASKELALEALLVDPVINSSIAAVQLLDELWEINKEYIRPCV